MFLGIVGCLGYRHDVGGRTYFASCAEKNNTNNMRLRTTMMLRGERCGLTWIDKFDDGPRAIALCAHG